MQNNYGITWDHTENVERSRTLNRNLTAQCNN
jgi:hypothetical protein